MARPRGRVGGAMIRMGGGVGHIRGSGVVPCAICGFVAEYRCDYPMGRGRTCDAHLCERHAIVQGRIPTEQLRLAFVDEDPPEEELMHFCPAHHLIARK